MDNRRLALASWREAGRSLLTRSGRLLSGFGLAASSPLVASAARKDTNREDDGNARDSERRDGKDEDKKRENDEPGGDNAEAGKESNDQAKAENQESRDRTDRQERREDRAAEEDKEARQESADDEDRQVTRRQDADTGGDGEADDGNGRRTEELAQRNRDDEPVDDVAPTTPVAPSNPNVTIDDVPDLTDAELVIEANPDVIASVSTSGGFAFARSGDVIAVSGPDGAQIIQTDDPEDVVTPALTPDEPSDDGGNNDVEFSS